MVEQTRNRLGHGVPHVALGLLSGTTVAEASGRGRASGVVAFVLRLSLNDDFKAEKRISDHSC
jgi:hypothetical protein